MHRYNICNRLITGELFYLSKHQQWVSDVTQAVTLNSRGTQTQRLDEGADAGDYKYYSGASVTPSLPAIT